MPFSKFGVWSVWMVLDLHRIHEKVSKHSNRNEYYLSYLTSTDACTQDHMIQHFEKFTGFKASIEETYFISKNVPRVRLNCACEVEFKYDHGYLSDPFCYSIDVSFLHFRK